MSVSKLAEQLLQGDISSENTTVDAGDAGAWAVDTFFAILDVFHKSVINIVAITIAQAQNFMYLTWTEIILILF